MLIRRKLTGVKNDRIRIPTGKRVDTVQARTGVEIVDRPLPIDLKNVVGDRDVDTAPPDVRFRIRMFDDALIGRRAACFFARVGDHGTRRRDRALRIE